MTGAGTHLSFSARAHFLKSGGKLYEVPPQSRYSRFAKLRDRNGLHFLYRIFVPLAVFLHLLAIRALTRSFTHEQRNKTGRVAKRWGGLAVSIALKCVFE